MAFKSWQSFWEFSRKILHDHRYIYDEEIKYFLNEVLQTSKNRAKILKKDTILWRSQLGSGTRPLFHEGEKIGEESCPYSPERMIPLVHAANEGRVNPKGIPYLYLATDKETAMGEARPWIGSEISVAQFNLTKTLKIVDCSVNHTLTPFYFSVEDRFYEPDEKEREKAVWAHIDKAFAEPVIASENQAHYAPTQILAELFKKNGFDGVLYKSALGKGRNIALFNLDFAEMLNCFLFKTENINFQFTQTAEQYFLNKIIFDKRT